MRAAALIVPLLLYAASAESHPAPFSYLDLRLNTAGVTGTLVVHDLDAAHDLKLTQAESLLDAAVAVKYRDALVALLAPRITIAFDGTPVTIVWGAIDVVPERQSVRLAFSIAQPPPGHTSIDAYVFPYDPIHQTFVNLYEDDALKLQAILDASRQRVEYYAGTTQGRIAVIRTFVLSGIEHILIGPDHILFLIGLLLLGGTLAKLAVIVTAFTIGHSITLSLAALDVLSPPAYFIEPLIALTIVIVGADNLLVLRNADAATRTGTPKPPSDIRAWLAAGFGLIHGFGFAYVLKEFGLPQAALGWSLFAFNLGVEIGQLLIVVVVAGALMFVRGRSAQAARLLAVTGSVAVIAAGAYWFIERVFLV
ncbi:MAG TPA: HupE/UreJ family protein [Vicinamibacterales bacterium]|nr:HupE/UreJ family protein [Vicinamibacterales bacterium]